MTTGTARRTRSDPARCHRRRRQERGVRRRPRPVGFDPLSRGCRGRESIQGGRSSTRSRDRAGAQPIGRLGDSSDLRAASGTNEPRHSRDLLCATGHPQRNARGLHRSRSKPVSGVSLGAGPRSRGTPGHSVRAGVEPGPSGVRAHADRIPATDGRTILPPVRRCVELGRGLPAA